MITRLMLIACLAAMMVACEPEADGVRADGSDVAGVKEMGKVTGTVWYRERMALPENAVVQVQLQDVSLQDVAATVLAEQVIHTGGKQVPFAFELEYDKVAIDPRNTYAISARITVDGKLWFINTSHHPVLTNGYGSHVDVMVNRTGGE